VSTGELEALRRRSEANERAFAKRESAQREELRNKEQLVERLQKQLQDKIDKNLELSRAATTANSTITQLRTQLAEKDARLQSLREESRKGVKLQDELTTARTDLAAAQARELTSTTTIQSLQSRLAAAVNGEADTRRGLAALQEQLTRVTSASSTTMREALDDVQREASNAREQGVELRRQVTRLQVDLTAAKGTIEQLTITKENFERQLTEERKMVKRLMSNEAKAVQQAQQLMIEAQRERSEAAALAQQMQFESVTASTEAALAKQDAERSRQLMVQRSQHLETTTQQLADHHRQLTERQQAVFSSAMERVAQRDSEAIRQMAAVNFEGVRLALQAAFQQQRQLELEMDQASVEAQQEYLGFQQQLHVAFAQQLRIDVNTWLNRLESLDTQRGLEWRQRVDVVNDTIVALIAHNDEVRRIAATDEVLALEWRPEPQQLLTLTAEVAHTMVGNLLLDAESAQVDPPRQQLLLKWHEDLPSHFQ
jgi:hypothetical protein